MSEVRTINLNPQAEQEQLQYKWWESKEEEMHRHIVGIVKGIRQEQEYRKQDYLKYARLYANSELLGFYGTQYHRNASNRTTDRLTLNVCKSCVDTSSAKIAKNKPRPLFLTDKGDYTKQTRAKNLTKYLEGAFDQMDLYTKGARSYISAGALGTGILKFYKDTENMRIEAEHVLTDEIVVDDTEGMYQTPRQMFQEKYVSRDILMTQFPQHKRKIANAKGGVQGETLRTSADVVKVTEAWHLKSGKEAKDGKHAFAIENCTLFQENYLKDYFPFVFMRYSPKMVGFWGAGIIENIVGLQIEINRILINIQKAQHLFAVPRIAVENSSMVNSQHLTNEFGMILKYTGIAPTWFTPSAMPPEVYDHLWMLYNKAFEIEGISQMNATGQKPSGLDAAVALREYNDIGTERFVQVGQRWEKLYMDASKMIIDMSRDLYEVFPDLSVNVKGGKFLETIRWKDVDLEDDQYIMRVFPTSILPSTPEGKLQTTQELMKAGFIGKEEAMSLLDFPDLEAFMNLQTASLDDINMMIEGMVEHGRYTVPEPQMNLQLAMQMSQNAYLRAKTTSVPEARQELLLRFMDECAQLLGIGEPPPPDMNAPQPLANPMPVATSDLLPSLPTGPMQ